MTHTVATLIETVCEQFEAQDLSYGHGTDNAWDEAVALVLTLTELPDDQASLQKAVNESTAQLCLAAAQKRIDNRLPLAYILGKCQYMGLTFEVCEGVVVPRSPIGYLLQQGLEPWLPDRVLRILDLCSGSGCLGIVAALLYPQASVTLVEMDPLAVAVARRNVERHALQQRVEVIQADVTEPLELSNPYDLIISNPPYVDSADMSVLPAEFRAEPAHGLAAGEDGLSVVHGIFTQLPKWLATDGLFIGEVGASAPALLQAYPGLAFIWPELDRGGEGVFVLEAAALSSHTARDSATDNR